MPIQFKVHPKQTKREKISFCLSRMCNLQMCEIATSFFLNSLSLLVVQARRGLDRHPVRPDPGQPQVGAQQLHTAQQRLTAKVSSRWFFFTRLIPRSFFFFLTIQCFFFVCLGRWNSGFLWPSPPRPVRSRTFLPDPFWCY